MPDDSPLIRRTQRYEINGVVYRSLDEVPQEFRSLLADRDGNGLPDMLEPLLKDGKTVIHTQTRVVTGPQSKTLRRNVLLRHAGDPARSAGFHCRQCGYDLSAATVSGNCPECGLAVTESIERAANSPPSISQQLHDEMCSTKILPPLIVAAIVIAVLVIWKLFM